MNRIDAHICQVCQSVSITLLRHNKLISPPLFFHHTQYLSLSSSITHTTLVTKAHAKHTHSLCLAMKSQPPENPYGLRNPSTQKIPNVIILLAATLLLLTLVPLYYPFQPSSTPSTLSKTSPESHIPTTHSDVDSIKITEHEKCDIFSGEWIPNPDAPYYTNTTCWAIHEHQNCMKYGRPDSEFMKWRWKPDSCELPIFNPYQFLEIVRGKSLAFVGDSVGRNQMQSLMCMLSRVRTKYYCSSFLLNFTQPCIH